MSETGSGDKNNVVEPTHAEEEVRVPMHDDTVVNPNQEETSPGRLLPPPPCNRAAATAACTCLSPPLPRTLVLAWRITAAWLATSQRLIFSRSRFVIQ
ncbi:hypothetical protein AGDE_15039 [Angomonas deanei]|uniref:Uncharacterized protein n=1 Tax=Angomonas deanei TaxID=59799 RepID=A0A7G2CCQ4_9TRYP|nr:hypothetical protein AGDE_15039 [Angomonas deanei]CAD2217225.1 hypothetical protein, conserved [Angomonas deanei]|eukprot:EPY19786.1 hypothetical protein AGDE_15039 [Angomonas deanei]